MHKRPKAAIDEEIIIIILIIIIKIITTTTTQASDKGGVAPINNRNYYFIIIPSADCLTPRRKFLRVDNFSSIFLPGGFLYASADHREGTPAGKVRVTGD